ncbi:MAG TPA: ArsA-related P-loop ATPase [Polyangiaceae bacterium]|nr:ArsA-related P-loop ATPase [Polyangiaceae bacterium]
MRNTLAPLLADKRVVVCAGAGGVGKTTVAASLALNAVMAGARALCITIDPARRLANSLGLPSIGSSEHQISPEWLARYGVRARAPLNVVMLDAKQTFDDLVTRHASSNDAKQRILDNRIYQYVSSSLAGTQSYMAMEKVLEVKLDDRFDVIVLDTPPMSHALDFLGAPERLMDAIDSPAVRALVQTLELSGRFSMNLLAKGLAAVLKGVGKITGTGFVEEVAEFVTGLNDLFGGFRQRALDVSRAFRGAEFGYVVVATPTPTALKEAHYFAWRLRESGMKADALVVNRVHPKLSEPATLEACQRAVAQLGHDFDDGAAEKFLRAAREHVQVTLAEQAILAELDALFPLESVPCRVLVPALAADVHGVPELNRVASYIAPAP